MPDEDIEGIYELVCEETVVTSNEIETQNVAGEESAAVAVVGKNLLFVAVLFIF